MNQRQEAVIEIVMGVLETMAGKPRSKFAEFSVEFNPHVDVVIVRGRTEPGGLLFRFKVNHLGGLYRVYIEPIPNVDWVYLKHAIDKAFGGLVDGE